MGTVLNDLADASTESESQIEVLFEAQAVNHPDLVEDDEYRISVGALFDASTITVAQDDLIYEADEPSIVSIAPLCTGITRIICWDNR